MDKNNFLQHLKKDEHVLEKLIKGSGNFLSGALLNLLIDLDTKKEWILKERITYIKEYFMTAYQFDKALRILVSKSLVFKKTTQVEEKTCLTIKVNYTKVFELLGITMIDEMEEQEKNDRNSHANTGLEGVSKAKGDQNPTEKHDDSHANTGNRDKAKERNYNPFSPKNWAMRR